ncbi:MAG: TylF/MycF family methyltransferase [Alphaproteobacteria bacterium]|nr:TylF/MycF family methyltransferase [Alphaproteobacteria bacterium SS10]
MKPFWCRHNFGKPSEINLQIVTKPVDPLDTKPVTSDPRSLYINLLLRTVANTIYRDRPQVDNPDVQFDMTARANGVDWPSVAHTMIGIKRLNSLRALCEQAIQENIPGNFMETGVWRGGACILMRGILAAYGDTERKVIVADSFEGLPAPNAEQFPHDAGGTYHEFDELKISMKTVASNFARYGLLDDQVVFLPGWFSDTLPKMRDQQFAVLRLDGDMYESTIVALDNLYDGLSPGGFIIIDDYGNIPECKKATDDFRATHGIDAELHQADWTGVWWRKPLS